MNEIHRTLLASEEWREVLRGDPAAGPPEHREPANDPDRQYPVLRGGEPC